MQSKAFIHGVLHFIIQIKNDYSYTCFSFGSSCYVVSLKSNSISNCKTWSALSEVIQYLPELEMTYKKNIVFDQLFMTDKKGENEKLYSLEITTRVFEYFSTSYSRLQPRPPKERKPFASRCDVTQLRKKHRKTGTKFLQPSIIKSAL